MDTHTWKKNKNISRSDAWKKSFWIETFESSVDRLGVEELIRTLSPILSFIGSTC